MIVNNIKLGDIIINEIKKNATEKGCYFTTYDIFEILDRYLYRKQIFQLLNISHSSYYKYKNEKRDKYVDKKLYNLYLLITNESFKEEFEECETLYLE